MHALSPTRFHFVQPWRSGASRRHTEKRLDSSAGRRLARAALEEVADVVRPEPQHAGCDVDGRQRGGGAFACVAVVNAAGAWSAQIARLAGIDIPIEPVRGQIVCTETLAPGTLRTNLSTAECYMLQKAHGEVIVGSTTERSAFDVSVRYSDMRALAAGAVRAVPALRDAAVKRVWAGLRPATPDEFPILGPDWRLSNFFHATGGFRTGIVAAPLSGEVVAASVVGERPPVAIERFLAERFRAIAV